MATEASNHVKYLMATKAIDFANDTFQIILMASGFTFNKDSHELYADVSASELSTGNGYTAGGETLAGVSVVENDTDDRTDITWASKSWTASGGYIGPSPGAIIYDDTVADDPIIGYIDFGGNQSQTDGGIATVNSIGVRIA